MSTSLQFIGFKLENEEFALPIGSIQEVLTPLPYTPLPKAPSYILGAFALHNEIIPLIDLRIKLGFSLTQNNHKTRFLIVRQENSATSLIVDEVSQIYSLQKEEINSILGRHPIIQGVAKMQDQLITILELNILLKGDINTV